MTADCGDHQPALAETGVSEVSEATELVLAVLELAGLHRDQLHLLHCLVVALLPHLLTLHLTSRHENIIMKILCVLCVFDVFDPT